jgi:carbamate kinase
LDDLVAQTQGMIGYWLAQSLHNAGVRQSILSIVTQTEVDPADPSFTAPTKFIGSGYPREQAQALADEHCWRIVKDGQLWRRVVASPEPQRIVEQRAITDLLEAGTVVICGGGGGAAVTVDADGQLTGVEAVVDKDYVAALLAVVVHADRLLVLTDVPAVMRDFGTPLAAPLAHLDLEQLGTMAFPAGSMQPKIEACRRFVAATGHPASIGALTDAAALLAGIAGTTITRGDCAGGESRLQLEPNAASLRGAHMLSGRRPTPGSVLREGSAAAVIGTPIPSDETDFGAPVGIARSPEPLVADAHVPFDVGNEAHSPASRTPVWPSRPHYFRRAGAGTT